MGNDLTNSDSADAALGHAEHVSGCAVDTVTEPAGSVLKQVQQRTRNRRQRRGKPPGWTLWVARKAGQSHSFFSNTLPVWLVGHREELLSYAFSLLLLSLTALLMALWVLPPAATESLFGLVVSRVDPEVEEIDVIKLEEIVQPEAIQDLDVNSNLKEMLSELDDGDRSDEILSPEDRDFTLDLEPTDAEMESVFKQGEFGGRSSAGKQAALQKYGGTVDSEQAVSSGLKWLQGIQQKDGSWNFSKPGPGASSGGFRRTEVGATSLALLCYLGAGHTHAQEGPFRETIEKGLAYIGTQVKVVQGTADLRGVAEGNSGMYVQGLATICISEAHALERRDKDLEKLTEMAVRFIEKAQDPVGGGWRYKPRDPGDTSVVGWQVMALQSAKAGRVSVSTRVLRSVREFLRSASGDQDGSTYKYTPASPAATNAMTAVGLLCRMYLGWGRDHEPLQKGVQRLSAVGPSRSDMYYNYYATQVLHHWGGEPWKKWNLALREQLVRTQVNDGPAAGSWAPTDGHGRTGGQIYQTALSILTLEVYYRHLPIYQRLENGKTDPTVVQ